MLTASHLAYEILRWVGAGYLAWMGLGMLWASRHRRPAEATPPEADSDPIGDHFLQGGAGAH